MCQIGCAVQDVKAERDGDNRECLAEPVVEDVVESGAHEAGTGDGENPGPDDAPGDAPMHGGEPAGSADAGNGSGDDVR